MIWGSVIYSFMKIMREPTEMQKHSHRGNLLMCWTEALNNSKIGNSEAGGLEITEYYERDYRTPDIIT
jgi:hypothetical protein